MYIAFLSPPHIPDLNLLVYSQPPLLWWCQCHLHRTSLHLQHERYICLICLKKIKNEIINLSAIMKNCRNRKGVHQLIRITEYFQNATRPHFTMCLCCDRMLAYGSVNMWRLTWNQDEKISTYFYNKIT